MINDKKKQYALQLVGICVAWLVGVWLGSLAVACRTSDREVAGSTPGRSTAR